MIPPSPASADCARADGDASRADRRTGASTATLAKKGLWSGLGMVSSLSVGLGDRWRGEWGGF